MVLVAVLVFLLMRQIMPIAAGLAGGIALSSFGTLSRIVSWGMRRTAGAASTATKFGLNILSASGRSQRQLIGRGVWHEQ
jgi:type IV secretion system protein VirB6